jgi:hypothetical protein
MIKTFKVGNWSVLIILLIISVILYFPVLDKGFVSDDFTVLFRLINTKDFTPPGFFRPGADLSLYSTYLLSGLNPVAYNVTNLLIHVLNGWLVYLVCNKFFFLRTRVNSSFPLVASVIFLLYPFHQEPVVWALGRGILLSSFFALLSLYVLLGLKNYTISIISSVAFYFLSLLCYESGIFIPVIAFLMLKSAGFQKQKLNRLILLFGVAFAAHLIIRMNFSGSVIGAYGKDLDAFAPGQFLYEYVKFWFRLVMIPVSNVSLFLVFSFLILLGLFYAAYKIVKKDHHIKSVLIGLVFILFISFLIPAFFGIAIRTSEGDRFLYFPSIFFSVFLGIVFTSLNDIFKYGYILFAVVCQMSIYSSNKEWLAASQKVQKIIDVVKENSGSEIVIYNLPGSKNGKYIFRNGFREALYLNNIDTSRILINNIVEEGLAGLDKVVEPPIKKNAEKGYQLIGNIPFNLKPPFRIINFSDNMIGVFKVEN